MTGARDMPREALVRSMFDRIARRYDLMNSVMSAGLHHRWRARAVELAELAPGDSALDVCCGTGDFSIALKRAVGGPGQGIWLDFSEEMLAAAPSQTQRSGHGVRYRQGHGRELPLGDGR